MEEENNIEENNISIYNLQTEYNRLVQEFKELKSKHDIAIQGLNALYSGGEPTGIAKATIEEINKDLPQED